MDRRLLEACVSGDGQALQEFIQHDPLILHRAVTCCEETPLHAAVLCGHLSFVKAILSLKLKLAFEADATGCLPLHLASAGGSAEIVHELLVATDDEGNSVLHFAVFYKQIQTVRYLVSLEEVKAIARDTVIDVMEKNPRDMNSSEIAKTITRVGVGRFRNQPNNPTIVLHPPPSPSTTGSAHTDSTIWYSGHTNTSSVHTDTWYSAQMDTSIWLLIEKSFDFATEFLTMIHEMDWMKDVQGNLMVVATVIASMSFQAGINPPGGVWQADTIDKHNCTKPSMCRAGTAVFKDTKGFSSFYVSNTLAFVSAVSVILLLFAGFSLKNKAGTWVMKFITCLMLYNILWAYIFSTDLVVKPFGENKVLIYICYVWMSGLVLVMIIHTNSISYWDMFLSIAAENRLRSRKWRIPLAFCIGTFVTLYVLTLLGDLYGCTTKFSLFFSCLVGFG